MLNVIVSYGANNVFTFSAAAVYKHGKLDMGKTIEHIQDVLGKDATFKIV